MKLGVPVKKFKRGRDEGWSAFSEELSCICAEEIGRRQAGRQGEKEQTGLEAVKQVPSTKLEMTLVVGRGTVVASLDIKDQCASCLWGGRTAVLRVPSAPSFPPWLLPITLRNSASPAARQASCWPGKPRAPATFFPTFFPEAPPPPPRAMASFAFPELFVPLCPADAGHKHRLPIVNIYGRPGRGPGTLCTAGHSLFPPNSPGKQKISSPLHRRRNRG